MVAIAKRQDGKAWIGYGRTASAGGWQRDPWGIPADRAAAVWSEGVPFSEALRLIGGDLSYRLSPVFGLRSEPDQQGKRALPLDGASIVVAHGGALALPEHAVSVVGSQYEVSPQGDSAAALDALGLRCDAAALLGDSSSWRDERRGGAAGARNGALAAGPATGWYLQGVADSDEIRAGPTGRVGVRAFARGSHDGTTRLTIGWSVTAAVCANTLAKASKEAKSSAGALNAAHRRGVGAALEAWTAAQAAAQEERRKAIEFLRMTGERQAAGDLSAESILSAAFPKETRATEAAGARILDLLDRADPSTGVAGDGSVLDVLQALTYWASHERAVRAPDWLADATRSVDDLAAPVQLATQAVRALVLA